MYYRKVNFCGNKDIRESGTSTRWNSIKTDLKSSVKEETGNGALGISVDFETTFLQNDVLDRVIMLSNMWKLFDYTSLHFHD